MKTSESPSKVDKYINIGQTKQFKQFKVIDLLYSGHVEVICVLDFF